jgi:hypothetical protein
MPTVDRIPHFDTYAEFLDWAMKVRMRQVEVTKDVYHLCKLVTFAHAYGHVGKLSTGTEKVEKNSS